MSEFFISSKKLPAENYFVLGVAIEEIKSYHICFINDQGEWIECGTGNEIEIKCWCYLPEVNYKRLEEYAEVKWVEL